MGGWKDEVYRRILDENDITDLDAQTLVDEYLADFNRHCIGFDLRPMLDALQPLGLRLGVITNGRYPFQQRNFEALSVADFFDIVVVSGAEQIRKPDPEIFHRARTYRRAAQIYRLRGRQPRRRHPRRAKCGHARCLEAQFLLAYLPPRRRRDRQPARSATSAAHMAKRLIRLAQPLVLGLALIFIALLLRSQWAELRATIGGSTPVGYCFRAFCW
ncbi:MAG: HAD hydrolase-like protein [Caldilineaceae bacterium]